MLQRPDLKKQRPYRPRIGDWVRGRYSISRGLSGMAEGRVIRHKHYPTQAAVFRKGQFYGCWVKCRDGKIRVLTHIHPADDPDQMTLPILMNMKKEEKCKK